MDEQIDDDDLDALVDQLGTVVGERVYEYRTTAGLTVADLAAIAGVSKAMVSKVENSRASASLSTLARLATALDVPITAFFRGLDEDHDAVLVRAGHGLTLGGQRSRRGASYELLGMLTGQHQRLEPQLVTFTSALKRFPLYQHNGSELIHMLEGSMDYGYGSATYTLNPGDTLQFIGEVSHGATAIHETPVRFLSIRAYGSVRDPRPPGRVPDA